MKSLIFTLLFISTNTFSAEPYDISGGMWPNRDVASKGEKLKDEAEKEEKEEDVFAKDQSFLKENEKDSELSNSTD